MFYFLRFLHLITALAFAFTFGACSPAELIGYADSKLLVDGVSVEILATNTWDNGFNCEIRVANISYVAPITQVEVVFSLKGNASPIGAAWNGDLSTFGSSNKLAAKSPASMEKAPIIYGQAWNLGFRASGAFEGATISSVTINGNELSLENNENNAAD